ncbi:MAG: Zn-ribbon domain-containing OB-fold protein [Caldimonas sp.]
MSDGAMSRPLPDTRNAGAAFWSAAADGRLLVPECAACGRRFWHPRPRCPFCGSERVDWIESKGVGTIHTFTVVRQSGDPFFKTKVPYAVAMIDLDEGIRMMSSIVETPLEALRIGLRVEVVFEDVTGSIGIPLFRIPKGRG